MPAKFDNDLKKLKARLLEMGALAEKMLLDIKSVFIDQNDTALSEIYENEKMLDHIQVEIDEETIRLICVYTPVAGDLRLLMMITRINAEIERVGDQIEDIARIFENYRQDKSSRNLIDFSHVTDLTQKMLHDSLESFMNRSSTEALAVIKSDNQVDHLTDTAFRVLFTHMLDSPQTIGNILGLMLASQALERIADHAVNIAEDVVYMVKGEDIRHRSVTDKNGAVSQ